MTFVANAPGATGVQARRASRGQCSNVRVFARKSEECRRRHNLGWSHHDGRLTRHSLLQSSLADAVARPRVQRVEPTRSTPPHPPRQGGEAGGEEEDGGGFRNSCRDNSDAITVAKESSGAQDNDLAAHGVHP